MANRNSLRTPERREFLLAGSGAAALVALLAVTRNGPSSRAETVATKTAASAPPGAAAGNGWQAAYDRLIGGAKPIAGNRVKLEMSPVAENGNMVPFTVAVDSPMTDRDHVKAIHLLATGNPQPTIASFHLSPQCGEAIVASRMRLAQSQDLIVLAELSDGRFLVTRHPAAVAIGGCGV